jgi:UDP-N-acetylmuramate--alanine ligase
VSTKPWRGRRLHLIGVGGAGMSAYARAAHELGASVSGSDQALTPFAAALVEDGVLASFSACHHAAALPPSEGVEVYYSSAIPAGNPEREAALARGLTVRPRADLLGELSALRRTIAVAGAHGKTTTAAMIAHVLIAGDLDPGYLIGGVLRETARGGHWGTGEWLVVEADESDRSLLALSVEIAVLTNVELDHHDRFGSLHEIESLYREFLANAPRAVIWDRSQLRALRDGGALRPFDAHAELTPGGSRFVFDGVPVELAVPGEHNARNAAAALAVAEECGLDLELAARALASFRGVGRRFERIGMSSRGAEVYDDYAHHPTEIAATLAAARSLAPRRLIAAFQPHLYSRTRALAREFGGALAGGDIVVVLDVYPARERAADHPGVSGLLVAEATADAARGRPVYWLPDRERAQRVLRDLLEPADLLVVMGAGDIDELGRCLSDG